MIAALPVDLPAVLPVSPLLALACGTEVFIPDRVPNDDETNGIDGTTRKRPRQKKPKAPTPKGK